MKLSFGKRVVLFFHWLISVLLMIKALIPQDWFGYSLKEQIGAEAELIVIIACAALYAALCVWVFCILLGSRTKRADRGLITVDSAETGKIRIAVSALEQMVRQAITAVDGIAEMKIGISSEDDAIEIGVNVSLVNGSHVPTVTLNMQRAIRQFVEMNCGVAVHSVSISIQNVVSEDDASKKGKRIEPKTPAVALTPGAVSERVSDMIETEQEAISEVDFEGIPDEVPDTEESEPETDFDSPIEIESDTEVEMEEISEDSAEDENAEEVKN